MGLKEYLANSQKMQRQLIEPTLETMNDLYSSYHLYDKNVNGEVRTAFS